MITYLRFFILILTFSLLLPSVYNVGDQVSDDHQNTYFDVCHGNEEHGFEDNLSLGDLNGFTNGGIYYVTMIDMAASW